MTKSSAYMWSRRALAGTAIAAACVGTSIQSASAAGVHPATVPSCATSSLHAHMGSNNGTAGATYTSVNFTNISGSTCTLYGYPGISLAVGHYTQVGESAAWNYADSKELVTLAPGATGSAIVKIADAYNFPPATCDPTSTTYLVVYPPNNTVPIHLSYPAVTCAGSVVTMLADPVLPGATS